MPSTPNSPPISFSSTQLLKPSHRRSKSNHTTPVASRDSSLQTLWAQDYFTDDCGYTEGLNVNFGEIAEPPKATLTVRPYPRSIPLSAEEEAYPGRQTRKHQRSLTELLPFRPTTSPNRSPIKEISQKEFEDEFIPTLTGDQDRIIKVSDKPPGGIAGWFSGASAPVQLGVPIMEQNAPTPSSSSRNPSPERTPTKLQKRPTLPSLESSTTSTPPLSKTSQSTTSLFGGFFSSPKTPSKSTIQLPSEMNEDSLLTLSIHDTLFPSGPADPFSPSSFKNLLQNAEGLLTKLQTAYKLRTLSLQELAAEKEAQEEEFEEAEIRAQSLRSQLEDMSNKFSAQEIVMKELAAELAGEKQARLEERETREKSIMLVKAQRESYNSSASVSESVVTSPSEELFDGRKGNGKWRESYGSTTSISDTDDGLFSRAESPSTVGSTVPSTYTQSNASVTEIGEATFARVVQNPGMGHHGYNKSFGGEGEQQRPKMVQQRSGGSALQRVLKSMKGEEGCTNCEGGDVRVAWDTVSVLKAENKVLKDRVGELEGRIEGVLGLVGDIQAGRVGMGA